MLVVSVVLAVVLVLGFLTVSACGGVEFHLFPGLVVPSAVVGPVADCMEVGQGG